MNILTQLEHKIASWFKAVPGLPSGSRKWLGDNAWIITIVFLVSIVLSIMLGVSGLDRQLSMMNSSASSYYVSSAGETWSVIVTSISLAFLTIQAVLLAFAIKPLKEKQKKGWVLLFAALLVDAIAIAVNALLSLNLIVFIISILFNAIGLAVIGYFLYEIHGQFAHVEKSRGSKRQK
jgi:NADH:ubiquinone oxidoreductase subunit 4 (subunit M)